MRVLVLLSVVLWFATLIGTGAAQAAAVRVAPMSPALAEATGPGTQAARALTHDDLEAWLDGYLPYALKRGDVAGAVVMVVKDGKVLLGKGYGYADIKAKTPVDPQRTIFRPGSTSKLFTWTAVMQLVEQGKLNLDTDINAYLDFKIPPRDGKAVTLRNLMTHTGGFEETLKGVYTLNPKDLPSFDRYIKIWIPKRVFPAGQVPAYSNYGTALAGYIVERVSGEPFADYVDRHILKPLDMRRSTFVQPLPAQFQADMAKGYPVASAPPKPFELYGPSPAGALSATGEDMAHFMIAHLQNGAYGQARILRPETAQMMHGTPLTILPGVNRMVLGFYETDRNGHRIIAHAGDTQLFHSVMHLYLDDGVGLFVSMNSSGAGGAADTIRAALFEGFTDRYFPGSAPDGRVDPKTAAAHARLIAGEYVNSRRSQTSFLSVLGLFSPTKVTDNGDGTISVSQVNQLNEQPKRWREIAPFLWRDVDGKERLSARVEQGRVTMFSFDDISPFMVLMRPPAGQSPALLLLGLKAAAVVIFATLLFWPTIGLVRRGYGASFPLSGGDAHAHRAARIGLLLAVGALLAWVWTFVGFIDGSLPMTSQSDGWMIALRLVTLVTFAVAVAAATWNLIRTWSGPRRGFGKLWSLAMVAATVLLLWTAVVFHLVGFGTGY